MLHPLMTRLPEGLRNTLRRYDLNPTRLLLTVSVAHQSMVLWRQEPEGFIASASDVPRRSLADYLPWKRCRVSTSRFGIGQQENSLKTPLGLHRIARKIGGGHPTGTVFRHRVPIGYTWQGMAHESIVHRILWLEGAEPGFNRGGPVDTFRRYIYIHGYGDETTLGRPKSRGCIHLAGKDLLPLYDQAPLGTLVWIGMGEH